MRRSNGSLTDLINARVISNANFIVETKGTLRSCAKHTKVGKSTVHKDIAERLPNLDRELYNKVQEVIMTNKQERCIRGGLAFKNIMKMRSKNKEGY